LLRERDLRLLWADDLRWRHWRRVRRLHDGNVREGLRHDGRLRVQHDQRLHGRDMQHDYPRVYVTLRIESLRPRDRLITSRTLVLLVVLAAACDTGKPKRAATAAIVSRHDAMAASPASSSSARPVVTVSRDASTRDTSVADAAPEPAVGHWTRGLRGQRRIGGVTPVDWYWTRSPGLHAPPLIFRGIIVPSSRSPLGVCDNLEQVREGPRGFTNELHLTFEGTARPLYVWAMARGSLGVALDYKCAIAAADKPLRIATLEASTTVDILFGEVDRPKERSGRTFPFVLVVSEEPMKPDEAPDPEVVLPAEAVSVRWGLTRATCPTGLEYWRCWQAALELGGAAAETIPIGRIAGQWGCSPWGTGIWCNGPSGMDLYALDVSPSGDGKVTDLHESDGACPEHNCGTTTVVGTFRLPPGISIKPDPLGTFPPL